MPRFSLKTPTLIPALFLFALAGPDEADGQIVAPAEAAVAQKEFYLEEATIADIQGAIRAGDLTAEQLVALYLARIKAYNGTCVNQPEGILGPVTTIPDAGQINALATLNLRPATRVRWGFDSRKARSMTDADDDDPAMPDALETARALDAHFAATGEFVGPLHGVVTAIKDQYDTFDMRTTSGADAFYADDRPPDDATFVSRLREAGAIIIAKSNLGEFASAIPRSAFGGTFCNPYDTERSPGGSSAGSGSAVGRKPRDLCHCRGNGLVDPEPGVLEQQRRHLADAGAREPRRHDPAGHQHARRPDLPHGRGRRARSRRHRGLRSEGRASRRSAWGACLRTVMRAMQSRAGSWACASASYANTWTRRPSRRRTRRR